MMTCPICESVMHLHGREYACRSCGFRMPVGSPNAFYRAKHRPDDSVEYFKLHRKEVAA